MIDDLNDVDDTKTAITASVNALTTAMTNVGNDIDTTFTNCGATCGTPPDTTDLKSGSNFNESTVSGTEDNTIYRFLVGRMSFFSKLISVMCV